MGAGNDPREQPTEGARTLGQSRVFQHSRKEGRSRGVQSPGTDSLGKEMMGGSSLLMPLHQSDAGKAIAERHLGTLLCDEC